MILFLLLTAISLGHGCENIREPLCQTGISYNLTVFPNLAGHSSQGDASVEIQKLKSLIERKCSPNIREFLCGVFMPECSSSGQAVMPSWEMCQKAFTGCATAMSQLGYSWASSLNCTRFEVSSVESVKKIAEDKSAFWFGNGVESLCRQPHATLMCKITQRVDAPNSIITRLEGKIGVSSIDRLIDICFTYPKGTYVACGYMYSFEGGSFEVDPVSNESHYPWQVQNLPNITWRASASEYYTLLMYDVELFRIHGLYTNIQKNNIQAAEEIEKYAGYTNPADIPSPFVFMLFAQSGRIQMTDNLKNKLKTDPIQTLVSNTHFSGPKAMSWVRIKPDPFAIEILNSHHVMNNCPLLITKAIKYHPEPFIPRDVKLEMSVVVSYSPKAITFTSCCKTYHYRETSFKLNPVANMTVKTAHVRTSEVPSVTLIKRDLYPMAKNFTNELYSLIMVDPDVPSRAGNPSHPFLSWMVLNIPNGNVKDGEAAKVYKGPQPPNGANTFYFLVYKQTGRIPLAAVNNYTSNSCDRCNFDINKFTQDQQLTLTGATWMIAETDEYVRHVHVDEGNRNIATECAHQPQYPSACSSSILEEIVG